MAAEGNAPALGRYRFCEVLSTSFFGRRYRVVYEGSSGSSDRPAADSGRVSRSSLRPRPDVPLAMRLIEADVPNLLERLAHSVTAVRDVDHRAVMRPLQIVRSNTRMGIVTPDIEGVTLTQLLEHAASSGEAIAPGMAVGIVLDVAAGLQALCEHARGGGGRPWVHGGVTPDSILVGSDGQARLIDPGAAAAAARKPHWAHAASALAYTPPEQTGADAHFDAASDTFALGVMLWEALSSRALFRARTAAETLERVHRAPIPRVQRTQFVRGEPLSFALAQVVSQALRREPQQRFTDHTQLMAALEATGEAVDHAQIAELVKAALPEFCGEAGELEPAAHARMSHYSLPPISAHRSSRPPASGTADGPERTPSAQRRIADRQSPDHARQGPAAADSAQSHDALWPANPSWEPPPLPEKITAFPIGDLLRRKSAGRSLGSLALAAAAVLGLFGSIWALLGPSGVPRTLGRSAAGRPALAPTGAGLARPAPQQQPVTNTPPVSPQPASDAGVARQQSAMPNRGGEPVARPDPGAPTATLSPAGDRRRPSPRKAAAVARPTRSVGRGRHRARDRRKRSKPAPFIPDDI